MANLQDIRRKINSTKKTQQTTRAMKMVSAAKLRKAQERIVNARPYAHRMNDVIMKLAKSQKLEHPLLGQETSDSNKMLLVVLTSDRGLCGAFNSSIIKYTKKFYLENKDKYDIDLLFIGRKGYDFFRKQLKVEGIEVINNLVSDISYNMAAGLSEKLLQYYLTGEYSEIRMIYNEFKSAISQTVVDEILLPIRHEETTEDNIDFIFEPDAMEILDQLLTKHFSVQVYKCLQESVASEHGARMSAMENATRNAGEMIKAMTLHYNKVRQAAITTELIEITSGAEALKG